jgi:hypothetical protein
MLSSWETSSVGCATALEQNVKRLVCQYGRVVKCMNNKISNEEEREIKEEKREAEDETDENKGLIDMLLSYGTQSSNSI